MVDLTYTPSVQPEGLPGRAFPRIPDEANPAADGADVGHAIEGAAGVMQAVSDKAENQARVAQLTDAHNQLQAASLALTHDPQTGAFTKQGKDAFNLQAQYAPQFDQAVQKIGAGIADPRAAQAFQQTAAQMRNQFNEQLDTHEISQHQAFADHAATAGIKLAQQAMAANYQNGDIIATNRDALDFNLEQWASIHGIPQDSPQFQEAKQEAHLQAYQGVISNMLTDKKPGLAKTFLDSLPAEEVGPGERKVFATAIQKGQADAQASSIVDTYRNLGPNAGANALKQVDSITDPDLRSAVLSSVDRGISQWHQEAQQTHQNDIISLEAKLASGQTTSKDVGSVYGLIHSGALTPEQGGNMIGRIQRKALDDIADDTFKNYAAKAVAQGQSLDPQDKDLRKGMDAYFQDATNGFSPGSQTWINRGADIARKTGIVPDSMVAYARTQLVSGDPQAAAAGASAIMRAIDAVHGVPYALKDDKETISAAKIINDAVEAGTNPVVAVENQRQIFGMSDAAKKGLEQQYSDKKLQQSSLGTLRNLLSADPGYSESRFLGMGHTVPDVPPPMLGAYEQLRQDYYKTTGGNVKAASELAADDLKHVWGISEVNGQKEWMPYAPEAQHAGLTTDAVKDAMQDFVAKQAGVTSQLVDRDKIHLTPTVDTATTGGKVWTVSVPDKYGAYGPIMDKNNNPVTFTLPNATQGLKSQATTEILDKMQNEKKQQDQENEGNAWLHMGLLKQQQAEAAYKQTNATGETITQGRRLGF